MEELNDDIIDIQAALRHMLLPISTDKEKLCIDAIIKTAAHFSIPISSLPEFLTVKLDAWKSDKAANVTFKSLIIACLKAPGADIDQKVADNYFDLHALLITDPFISFELATIILSHLRFIISLAIEEKMSSAKITKVIVAIDHRLSSLSWKNIANLLAMLKMPPQLELQGVQQLYEEDKISEERYFADAGINEAALQIGQVAHNLQFSNDLGSQLMQLVQDGNAHLPYLQILNYQCLISGFYDHVFSMLYEFSPRGVVATWLFSKWDKLLHTSNPFLNNAKAVDVLDINWARSRKPNEYEKAVILVEILKGFDGLGFAAAQELSSWIRRWLIRYIKLNEDEIIPITSTPTEQEIEKLIAFIKSAPTATYGILEQRYGDVFAAYKYPKEAGWRSRGLGDPVNANNLSQKKLGDCDFQDSQNKIIIAYEAHGGILSKIYFEGHMRTLRRSFQRRKEEMESIADISEWRLKLVFIAYGFDLGLLSETEIDGLKIDIEYKTFDNLYTEVDIKDPNFVDQFKLLFIDKLNSRRTPKSVRDLIKEKMQW